MKTTVDYGRIPDREERDKKALQDIEDYVGKEKYEKLVLAAKSPDSGIEMLEFFPRGALGYRRTASPCLLSEALSGQISLLGS